MGKNIGEDFQTETKYFRNKRLGGNLDWANKPEIYKSYSSSKTIQLPNEFRGTKISFSDVLQKRRSMRTFSDEPLNKVDLAFLLWASTGIQRIEHDYAFRTAPSAGALYPIETYIAVNNVVDLDKGVYHYNIENHVLEEIKLGDFGETLSHAALDQEMCADSTVVFIWTAVFQRSVWKYSQRGFRYVYLDAGHLAQNLALAATSINCGSCHIGAFFDDEINSVVDVDGKEESAICLSVVGHPK